ncbi:MAG: hypothetical protein ACYDAZ_06135 [Thermoplasmataceae archaeon]
MALNSYNQYYPEDAYKISRIGGWFVLAGGAVELMISFFAIFISSGYSSGGFFIFVPGLMLVFSLPGILGGIMILTTAESIKNKPTEHKSAGVALIILAFFSFFSFGGFIVGFFATLIGGVMALTWTPANAVHPAGRNPGYTANTTICKACSNVIPVGSNYCPHCSYPT